MKKIKSVFDEKFIKFIIVGVINTIVGSAIMFGLMNLVNWTYLDNHVYQDFGYWFSTIANYVLTSILSFFLNKYFTFKSKANTGKSIIKFAINIIVCMVIAYGIAKPLVLWIFAGASPKLRDNVALFVGMVLFTGLNYFGQRFFAFKEEPTEVKNEQDSSIDNK
ncbi:MAG: GtrA family protein [Bacillota bacterium]|nr:GtrA family protein [Bacillota bacterium]